MVLLDHFPAAGRLLVEVWRFLFVFGFAGDHGVGGGEFEDAVDHAVVVFGLSHPQAISRVFPKDSVYSARRYLEQLAWQQLQPLLVGSFPLAAHLHAQKLADCICLLELPHVVLDEAGAEVEEKVEKLGVLVKLFGSWL